jgi:hypothetical protein
MLARGGIVSRFEVLTPDCSPEECAKVAIRRSNGRVTVVGDAITDLAELAELGLAPHEGAVDITETLYRVGYQRLVEREL